MYYCYGKGVQESVLCREVVPSLGGSFIGGSTVAHPCMCVCMYVTTIVSKHNRELSSLKMKNWGC